MAFLIDVQDINHERVERFGDDDNAFYWLTERAKQDSEGGWRVLVVFDRFSDTMLNRIQQEWFLSELEEARRRPDLLGDAGPIVDRLLAATRWLWEEGGYLMVHGE